MNFQTSLHIVRYAAVTGMEVVAEKNVLDDECEVREIQDESKVQDSLIDDWSKKVLSESETTKETRA